MQQQEHEAAGHICRSQETEGEMLGLSSVSPFHSAWDSAHEFVSPPLEWVFQPQLTHVENSSLVGPAHALPGSSKMFNAF